MNENEVTEFTAILPSNLGFPHFYNTYIEPQKTTDTLVDALFESGNIIVDRSHADIADIIAAYMLWSTIVVTDRTSMVALPEYTDSIKLLGSVRTMHRALPNFMTPKIIKNNKRALEFENGNYIIGSSSKNSWGCRGHALSFLYMGDFDSLEYTTAKHMLESAIPAISPFPTAKTVVSLGTNMYKLDETAQANDFVIV